MPEGETRIAEVEAVGRGVFFTRSGSPELWKSDGTPEGTEPVAAIGSEPLHLTRLGSRVFFTAEDASHGRELWGLPFRPEDACEFDALGR